MKCTRMILLRTMRHDGDIAVGIVEVDKEGRFIYAYSMYLGATSRREVYRVYSNWLLDFVNRDDIIEVKTCDYTATDPKKKKFDSRLKYFNSRWLVCHGFLNYLASEALSSKESKEMEINGNRAPDKTKEVLPEQTEESSVRIGEASQ